MEQLEIVVIDLHSSQRIPGKKKTFRPSAENPDEYAKSIGDAFKRVGGNEINISYIPTYTNSKIDKEKPSIDVSPYNLIIFSGSNYPKLFSPNEDGKHRIDDFAKKLVVYILEEAIKRNITIYGECAFHQILAFLNGHDVVRLANPVAGVYKVRKTELGKKSRVLKGLPDEFLSFGSHGKKVQLNGKYESTCLAENGNCTQIHIYPDDFISSQGHQGDTEPEIKKYLSYYLEYLGRTKKTQPPSKIDLFENFGKSPQYKTDGAKIIENIINIAKN